MIKHYLKISLRNLLKYKVHSLISAICLAVGIVCYTVISYVFVISDDDKNLPNYDQRISITVGLDQGSILSIEEVKRIKDTPINGLECLTVRSYTQRTEVEIIDKEQNAYPFLIGYSATNANSFSYYDRKLLYGNQLPQAPDEVVLSQKFALKAFGIKSPIGSIVHLSDPNVFPNNPIRDFKVVNVIEDNERHSRIDCYFPLDLTSNRVMYIVNAFLSPDISIEHLNKSLQNISWQRDEQTVHPSARFISQNHDNLERKLTKLLVLFLASLILISGLINFLKFIIQMFYNRQREVALRKCMGSDIKGLFLLLFSEVFWMITVAFLFSLVLTEIVCSVMQIYLPAADMPYISLKSIYEIQLQIYAILLVICLLIICVPIYRLRHSSISSLTRINRNRHIFRTFMMWLQLSIAIFFVGATLGINMAVEKIMESDKNETLSPIEVRQIISIGINSQRMWDNINPLLNDIRTLPEITDQLSSVHDIDRFNVRNYKRPDHTEADVMVVTGNPHYFDFFKIPLEGEKVANDAEGVVYVSERLKKELDKDSIQGMLQLENETYRIVGTYKSLYKEGTNNNRIGSVFIPSLQFEHYLFKVAEGKDVNQTIRQITQICRKYVPETLPLDIRMIADERQSIEGARNISFMAITILAFVSVLLVILSIYSAISLDTINRQKEMAIRKINGATPLVIGRIFGKIYLIIFLLAFITAYPLTRLLLMSSMPVESQDVYSWGWAIILFVSMAVLVILTTAYKINRIMHINPAEVIKNE